MKEITIKLYSFDELSTKAQERALQEHISEHDDPMMQSHMINLLKEELDERKIKYNADSINVMYSLGYSQGDGLMFEGKITWHGLDATIKHSGRYYHEYSRIIDMPAASEKEYAAFDSEYVAICKKIAQAGYREIEYQHSKEHFGELCEANDYTFEEDGAMRNE